MDLEEKGKNLKSNRFSGNAALNRHKTVPRCYKDKTIFIHLL
jgi:stress-induced morphogen